MTEHAIYNEYLRLRELLGFEPEHAMSREQWDSYPLDSQSNMLHQLQIMLYRRNWFAVVC